MKHQDHFRMLLQDTVNLSKFKLDLLETRSAAVFAALAADPILGPYVREMIRQGSWAQETIIQPAPGLEFDADFLLRLDENAEWSLHPKAYIDQVYLALGRDPVYKEMEYHRKCRCVRLIYADFCHVDIVPHLVVSGDRKVIVNRDEDAWEDTNPAGVTQWMRDKDGITAGNLRRVIRLMKFLRDRRGHFEGTRSIILTTMLGNQVEAARTISEAGYYATVPDALVHIVQDLDQWLQAQGRRPVVYDPSGSGLTFDHRWSDTAFEHFRDRISCFAEEMAEAYHDTNRERSVERWQDIFGPGFKAPPPKQTSGRFEPVAPLTPRAGRAG